MASAKKEAQKSLGSVEDYINLSGLNRERELANNMYNTNYSAYTNAYNDMLNKINSDREAARTDFGTGRSTIAENAYLKNRSDLSDLASRGLSGGVAQLSKLGNRMETGRQYSNLANTYYNRMNELDASQKSGENDYNYNVEMAQNSLNSMLADVDAREAAARNAYKAAVAQLAEQIQARRDANANAAAARADARKAAALQADQDLAAKLSEIAGTGKNLTKDSYEKAIAAYKLRRGGSTADAVNFLTKYNIGKGVTSAVGPVTPYDTVKQTTAQKIANFPSTTTGKVVTGALGVAVPVAGATAQTGYYAGKLGTTLNNALTNKK